MSIATDVRAYADLVLEQGKTVLSQAGSVVDTASKRLTADAPKPVFAAFGVADLLAQTVTKRAETVGKWVETVGRRVETLPADAVGNVAKAQETGRALISRTQDDALARFSELRERLDAGLGSVRSLPALPMVAANTTSGYLPNARQVYGELTARGEARVSDLRQDPRLNKLLGELTEVSATVQGRLAPVLGTLRAEVRPYLDSAFDAVQDADLSESAAATEHYYTAAGGSARKSSPAKSSPAKSSPAQSSPAKSTAAQHSTTSSTTAQSTSKHSTTKAPASKATASKASASKASASKASASKASASKATASKATAKKATARKAPAKKASTARKAPAKKASTARKAPANKA